MTVRSWYKNLSPKTRIMLGAGVMAYAVAGMYLSDVVEEKIGFVPTEEQKEELRKAMPRITVVDREKKG